MSETRWRVVVTDGKDRTALWFGTAETQPEAEALALEERPGWRVQQIEPVLDRTIGGRMKVMSDIIDFLHARITEDETEARRQLEQLGMAATADLRAFAECEAKRKIIALADDVDKMDAQITGEWGGSDRGTAEDILKALAAVYASHSDYREEWRP